MCVCVRSEKKNKEIFEVFNSLVSFLSREIIFLSNSLERLRAKAEKVKVKYNNYRRIDKCRK